MNFFLVLFKQIFLQTGSDRQRYPVWCRCFPAVSGGTRPGVFLIKQNSQIYHCPLMKNTSRDILKIKLQDLSALQINGKGEITLNQCLTNE
jgi:hypothetical protein